MVVVGNTRPFPGQSIFGSISAITASSWRASTHHGVQQGRQCAGHLEKTRHGAYLEYTQNIMLQHQGEDPTDESRFTLESDSGRLLIWRERSTRYHQSNTLERHSYQGGGIMVWAGISLGGHTDLHVFQGGTLTGVRYRVETLDPYVRPYTGAIFNDFILMDNNAQHHRAVIVEEYFEGLGLERMEWSA
ncbi:transposable element Tcb2 transposase [Trichonephila clavipes]|nr:transposable element Tcb2 transposase [Trichonephila clavipes]